MTFHHGLATSAELLQLLLLVSQGGLLLSWGGWQLLSCLHGIALLHHGSNPLGALFIVLRSLLCRSCCWLLEQVILWDQRHHRVGKTSTERAKELLFLNVERGGVARSKGQR